MTVHFFKNKYFSKLIYFGLSILTLKIYCAGFILKKGKPFEVENNQVRILLKNNQYYQKRLQRYLKKKKKKKKKKKRQIIYTSLVILIGLISGLHIMDKKLNYI